MRAAVGSDKFVGGESHDLDPAGAKRINGMRRPFVRNDFSRGDRQNIYRHETALANYTFDHMLVRV